MQSKQDRFEVPCGTGYQGQSNGHVRAPSLSETSTLWDAHRQPDNEYEALMQCDFGEEPPEPADPSFLAETMSVLTPKEAAVVDFIVIGGMSYRQAGRYLGAEFPRKGIPKPYSKMGVSQIYKRALAKMRQHLEEQQ